MPINQYVLELKRNIIHLVLGCFVAVVALKFKIAAALLFGIAMIIGLVLPNIPGLRNNSIIRFVLKHFGRKGEPPARGATMFFAGSFIAALFFPGKPAFLGILALAFGDAVSAVVGGYLGHTPLYGKKTFEGTVSAFLASALVCVPFVGIVKGVGVGFLTALLELFAPVDDNLLIPPAVAFFVCL